MRDRGPTLCVRPLAALAAVTVPRARSERRAATESETTARAERAPTRRLARPARTQRLHLQHRVRVAHSTARTQRDRRRGRPVDLQLRRAAALRALLRLTAPRRLRVPPARRPPTSGLRVRSTAARDPRPVRRALRRRRRR